MKEKKARLDWDRIENIKNLKKGYLSQVVHELATMIIEHKAIIVLENLNVGFKRGRFKFEKQVYAKFEEMLIGKLNYLVFKDRKDDEEGGVLEGYQLTASYNSASKNGQNGVIFYVPAGYTSKIDPVTGFVNFFNLKYTNIKAAKEFIKRFKTIAYNPEENLFYFDFDYKDMAANCPRYSTENKSEWVIYSNSTRIKPIKPEKNGNKYTYKEITLTDEFKKLLDKYKVAYNNNADLQENILNIKDSEDKAEFWQELLYLIRLTLQLRNFDNDGNDYIISPIKDKDGHFFDSREEKNQTKAKTLPLDADANGAYNIARKGLMLVDKIIKSEERKKPNLAISNAEWFNFTQKNNNN